MQTDRQTHTHTQKGVRNKREGVTWPGHVTTRATKVVAASCLSIEWYWFDVTDTAIALSDLWRDLFIRQLMEPPKCNLNATRWISMIEDVEDKWAWNVILVVRIVNSVIVSWHQRACWRGQRAPTRRLPLPRAKMFHIFFLSIYNSLCLSMRIISIFYEFGWLEVDINLFNGQGGVQVVTWLNPLDNSTGTNWRVSLFVLANVIIQFC